MSTLNDSILTATGGPTVNDGLLDWFRDGGAGANSPLQDAEREWLIIQLLFPVVVLDTNNDLWMKFLPPPGAINDRQFAYWLAGPQLPTALLIPIGETASAVSPADASVFITVATDQFVKKQINGGALINLYDWVIQGVAADFELMASGASGDTGNLSGSAFNTWLPPPVSWTFLNSDDTPNNKAISFTLSVRRASDGLLLSQAPVSLQANVTAAPIIPTADLQPVSQTAAAVAPADASVDVSISSDGFVKRLLNGASFANLYQWLLTGVNTDFEFRASNLTGDTANLTGSPFNVWQQAPIGWTILNSDNTAGSKACSWTVEVRRVSDFIVLDTTTFTIQADVTPQPANADLQPISETSSAQSPANSTINIQVLTNGTVTKSVNGGAATVLYTWIVNGVAADFEFRPFGLTGDSGNLTGSAFGSFIAPPLTFTLTNNDDAAGTKSVDFSLDVRRVVGSVLLDTTTVSLDATVTPPAPNADLQPISETAATNSPTDATVYIEVAADGFVKRSINGGALTNLYQWLVTGTSTDFQFQGSAATGNTGNIVGTAFGSYFAAPVSWTLTNPDNATSSKVVDFTLSVRRVPDNTVLDTTTVHMVANVTLLPNADLLPVNQQATANSPSNSSVTLRVESTGFVTVSLNGGAFTNLYNYIVNGVAADFEIRGSNLTGDTGNMSGDAFNVWLPIAPVTWTLTNPDDIASTKNTSWTVEIRRVSDQVVLDTTTFQATAIIQAVSDAELFFTEAHSTAVSPGNATSKIEIATDGDVKVQINGGLNVSQYTWLLAGLATDFQFQASGLTGDTGNVTGSAFNTWLAPPVSWTLTNSSDTPGLLAADWTVEVRRVSDSVVLDSALFDTTAQVTPAAFDPAAVLFGAGELGCWFDASDMSTMWQNSAGSTPVTAVEQPVGRWADKSGRGVVATQATAASRPTLSARKNHLTYSEDFNQSYWTKTGCTTNLGGQELIESSANSTHSFSRAAVIAAVPNQTALFGATASFQIFPNGRTRAAVLIGNNTLARFYRVIFDLTGSGSVVGTPENVGPLANVSHSITNIGGSYVCTVSAGFAAETGGIGTAVYAVDTTSVTYVGSAGLSALFVEKGQFEWGYTSTLAGPAGNLTTGYQVSSGALSYDTVGFPHYLRCDGVDDWMQTTVMNLTASNELTSMVGVFKLSDNSQAVIYEFSNSTVSNAGVFGWVCPLTAGPNVVWRSRGTTTADASLTSGFASPIAIVATGESDISAPLSRIRANGQTAQNVATQGTGNFGNFAAYFARRGGSTNTFTGGLGQIIIRGTATTLTDIQNTEAFIAAKMGVIP